MTPIEPAGTIVAFEGHPETISTQLRLLPTSPQILVLPAVQCYLATNDSETNFQAHQYIRKTHDASIARSETARAFLQQATPKCKRLVFMNGGAPSAQAMCIRAIMQHDTQGDDIEAEAKFNFLVKEGLAGLEVQAKKWESHLLAHPKSAKRPPPSRVEASLPQTQQLDDPQEDPITRAMRAAEALDRETANLQPSNELDLTIGTRPRSLSLPMYGYSDNFGDAAPFYVFGAQDRRRANSDASVEETSTEDSPIAPSTPAFAVTHFDPSFDEPVQTPYSIAGSPSSPNCAGESYFPTFLHSPLFEALATSRSDVFDLNSSADVVFGEASLIHMRQSGNQVPVARVRSLDRIYPAASKFRDLCIPSQVAENPNSPVRHRPFSYIIPRKDDDRFPTRPSGGDEQRTILVRKHPNIVRVSPVPFNKKRRSNRSSYVDRGTDAEVIVEKVQCFVTVLPVTENLVIYLKDEIPDILLDIAIKGFKEGMYPILSPSSDVSDTESANDHLPGTPKSRSSSRGSYTPKAAIHQEPEVVSPSARFDDYDPYAYNQASWPPRKYSPIEKAPKVILQRPPTPQETPVLSLSDKNDRFYEFRIPSGQTAVATQNSLRSVLNLYFPPEAQGYRQFHFSLLPELEGLWKPIFRDAEPGSPRAHNRRMDLILAVGSQKQVKKDYSMTVIGLLDKLGSKNSGLSRSGRLDFRYLLANTMQAFTAQPLTSQTSDNPFNNPYLLATLIVPHLETYLALHSEVRYLLLEYPPEHLSTILALQKLVGVDLMKVAQIVDGKSGDLGVFKHIRGGSMANIPEKSSPLGKPPGSDVTVSKANFLLTSSANDAEIATFVATVRKILMDVSQFYVPEKPPTPQKKSSPQKSRPPPLSGNFSAFPKTNSSHTPLTPNYSHIPPPLTSPAPSTRPASIAETVRSFKSRATARTKRTKSTRQWRPPTQDGAESYVTYDPAEDSDYDFEERRLMPLFLLKPSRMQKPNSRKALKFLGLA